MKHISALKKKREGDLHRSEKTGGITASQSEERCVNVDEKDCDASSLFTRRN